MGTMHRKRGGMLMKNSFDRTTGTGFDHGGSRRLQDQFDTRRSGRRVNIFSEGIPAL